MVDERKFSGKRRKLKFIKEDISLNGKMDDKFKYFLWMVKLRKIRDFWGM